MRLKSLILLKQVASEVCEKLILDLNEERTDTLQQKTREGAADGSPIYALGQLDEDDGHSCDNLDDAWTVEFLQQPTVVSLPSIDALCDVKIHVGEAS